MRRFILSLAMAVTVLGPMVLDAVGATSDEDRAQQIAANLKQSGKMKDYRVGVKYQDGVAWLMGTVTSNQQKRVAEQIAYHSAGVEHVVSKLEVQAATADSTTDANVRLASSRRPRAGGRRQGSRPLASAPPRTNQAGQRQRSARNNMPLPYAQTGRGIQPVGYAQQAQFSGRPVPTGHVPGAVGQSVSYDNPQVPGYAWPSYAASPNYAALTYPKQYSPSAWPYIGPFYPYPQVPLGWRKVTLEWDDGWWFLDFKDQRQ